MRVMGSKLAFRHDAVALFMFAPKCRPHWSLDEDGPPWRDQILALTVGLDA
jgi:hypothetical protein